jgi:hypothetical protein
VVSAAPAKYNQSCYIKLVKWYNYLSYTKEQPERRPGACAWRDGQSFSWQNFALNGHAPYCQSGPLKLLRSRLGSRPTRSNKADTSGRSVMAFRLIADRPSRLRPDAKPRMTPSKLCRRSRHIGGASVTRRLRRTGLKKGAPLYGSSFCLSQTAAYQRPLVGLGGPNATDSSVRDGASKPTKTLL